MSTFWIVYCVSLLCVPCFFYMRNMGAIEPDKELMDVHLKKRAELLKRRLDNHDCNNTSFKLTPEEEAEIDADLAELDDETYREQHLSSIKNTFTMMMVASFVPVFNTLMLVIKLLVALRLMVELFIEWCSRLVRS